MIEKVNPFETVSGPSKLGTPKYLVLFLIATGVVAYILSEMGIMAGMTLAVLPFIFLFLFMVFQNPVVGLYTAITLGFFILGLNRYVKIPQVGISMDAILYLTFIALFFNRFHERINWAPAKKDITLLAAIWLGYGAITALNPEIRNYTIWLASFRGVSTYMFLFVTLTLMLINSPKRLNIFFAIWGICSVLASLKGISQLVIGVDPWEKAWLDAGAGLAHVIFGKLRVFSFYSDAGQFGANQGFTGVVFLILSMMKQPRKRKIFYLVVGILGIYGMLISGTRGAISVPLAGFMLYFILKKNIWVMASGFIILGVVYFFFKFTTIGQEVDQIRRMRTAFDPNDPSLQLRLSNQKKMRTYLASRPFGGGLGHAGSKAMKTLPNTFLAQTATDSWYVMIWAEQGVIGLVLHLFILFYIIFKTTYLVWFKIRDPNVMIRTMALASGMFGVMVASYGNAVLGSMPTAMVIYPAMAIMLNARYFDDLVFPAAIPLEKTTGKSL
jgi:hypothetical protein